MQIAQYTFQNTWNVSIWTSIHAQYCDKSAEVKVKAAKEKKNIAKLSLCFRTVTACALGILNSTPFLKSVFYWSLKFFNGNPAN